MKTKQKNVVMVLTFFTKEEAINYIQFIKGD